MDEDALKAGYAGDIDARTLVSGYGVALGCHARGVAIGVGSGRDLLLEIPPAGCGNAKRFVGINEHAPAWTSQDPDGVIFHASPFALTGSTFSDKPLVPQYASRFLAGELEIDGGGGERRVPEEVLDDRHRNAAPQQLDRPGVPQDMRVGEVLGDFRFLGPQVEHAPEAHGRHVEDLAFHVREVAPIGAYFRGDVQGDRQDPGRAFFFTALQGDEADFALAEVDVVLVVEAQVGFILATDHFSEASSSETEHQVGEPVPAPQAPLFFRRRRVVPGLEGVGKGIELRLGQV